jgi:hypothetical protein
MTGDVQINLSGEAEVDDIDGESDAILEDVMHGKVVIRARLTPSGPGWITAPP